MFETCPVVPHFPCVCGSLFFRKSAKRPPSLQSQAAIQRIWASWWSFISATVIGCFCVVTVGGPPCSWRLGPAARGIVVEEGSAV